MPVEFFFIRYTDLKVHMEKATEEISCFIKKKWGGGE